MCFIMLSFVSQLEASSPDAVGLAAETLRSVFLSQQHDAINLVAVSPISAIKACTSLDTPPPPPPR